MKITQMEDHSLGFYVGISADRSILNQSCHNTPNKSRAPNVFRNFVYLFRNDGGSYPTLEMDPNRKWGHGDTIDLILTNWHCRTFRCGEIEHVNKPRLILIVNDQWVGTEVVELGHKDDLDSEYTLACVISEKGQEIAMLDFQTSINEFDIGEDRLIDTPNACELIITLMGMVCVAIIVFLKTIFWIFVREN